MGDDEDDTDDDDNGGDDVDCHGNNGDRRNDDKSHYHNNGEYSDGGDNDNNIDDDDDDDDDGDDDVNASSRSFSRGAIRSDEGAGVMWRSAAEPADTAVPATTPGTCVSTFPPQRPGHTHARPHLWAFAAAYASIRVSVCLCVCVLDVLTCLSVQVCGEPCVCLLLCQFG